MSLKKTLQEAVRVAQVKHPGKRIDIYFQDEGRFGRHGRLTRIWVERGSRPYRIRQTEYDWVYVFGGVCPATSDTHACLMPFANTEVMNLYLEDFSKHLDDDVHAILVMDRAGWHRAKDISIPGNMTFLYLPAYSPELNPMELCWREMRQKKLNNRIFCTFEELDEAVGEAWLDITEQLDAIRSLCLFPWIESVVNNSN